jgi:Lon protease-like protein
MIMIKITIRSNYPRIGPDSVRSNPVKPSQTEAMRIDGGLTTKKARHFPAHVCLAEEDACHYTKRMELPDEAPVMTLPNATLFPQALMRRAIFELRDRLLLEEVLHSRRMMVIAMRKPGSSREVPCTVAGLGLVRFCLQHKDGTADLILEGLSRVQLIRTVRRLPFRVCRIRALPTPSRDSVAIDALMAKVRDLVTERIEQEWPTVDSGLKKAPVQEIVACLETLNDPDRVADLVSMSLLRGAAERQTILETIEVEARLKHLIHFLIAEIVRRRKRKIP